jgi:hypothetical protein
VRLDKQRWPICSVPAALYNAQVLRGANRSWQRERLEQHLALYHLLSLESLMRVVAAARDPDPSGPAAARPRF